MIRIVKVLLIVLIFALSNQPLSFGQEDSDVNDVEMIDPNQLAANDALAKATLRTLSTAAETYATVNVGVYPAKMTDLTQAIPPYIMNDYCGQSIAGYTYQCTLSEDGYEFIAQPVELGVTGTQTFHIITGGVLNEIDELSIAVK